MKKTKLIYGVGINDANYTVGPKINGKQLWCPFYKTWHRMIMRCYSVKSLKAKPGYLNCSVDDKWLVFSNFKLWMETQDWKGKHLDKDLLIQGNKVYGPLPCMFVGAEINTLLIDAAKSRGLFPIGVSIVRSNRYRSQCNVFGKSKHLGTYGTPEEAYGAYKAFKYKHIAEIANQQIEPLRTALLNYVIEP
tara:strand:+ start:169 stop:741 length:573 start_codon:yes stop_codon:yes gene_type:complete